VGWNDAPGLDEAPVPVVTTTKSVFRSTIFFSISKHILEEPPVVVVRALVPVVIALPLLLLPILVSLDPVLTPVCEERDVLDAPKVTVGIEEGTVLFESMTKYGV
jgi:hypothetical protein